MRSLRLRILDRYLITELAGPFAFGLSAFTLIFVATQILAISRLISDAHAPLWAVIEYFFWGLPAILINVLPMAMLLGVLLALQRLSGESEITAMKAGGISLVRIVAPLLLAGLVLSLITLQLQESFIPFANDRATDLREGVIKGVSQQIFSNLNVSTPLPGGGRQFTTATAYENSTRSLLNVTVVQYAREGPPSAIIYSRRANYQGNTWLFSDATTYHFKVDGSIDFTTADPQLRVDIGENPTQIVQRARQNDPEQMSRAEIADVITTTQLSRNDLQRYLATYHAKLARPFACFVFTLVAVPFGLRPARGGGGMSLGFGLAVAIVFVYFVISSIMLSIGALSTSLAFIAAWVPNVLFTAFGAWMLVRAERST